MTDDKTTRQHATPVDGATAQATVVSVEQLLADHREIVILHGKQRYRLRVTSNDKLILTK